MPELKGSKGGTTSGTVRGDTPLGREDAAQIALQNSTNACVHKADAFLFPSPMEQPDQQIVWG